MIEFLRKIESRGIKIAWVNLILITKSHNLQYLLKLCTVLEIRCDVDIFKLADIAQSINKKSMG